MPAADSLTCVTWNLHRGLGAVRRAGASPDPGRILEALRAEVCLPCPDLLALQEADSERPPYCGFLDMPAMEAATGLRHAHPDLRLRWGSDSDGFHGNILLIAPDIEVIAAEVLDLPGVYPRGAVVLEARRGDRRFRLITTHLSLTQVLRVAQMRTLGQFLDRRPPMQTVLLGDLNEWRPWGGLALSRRVVGRRLAGPAKATFPVGRPLLPLDRILSDGPVTDLAVRTGDLTRRASDHAALSATIRLVDERDRHG